MNLTTSRELGVLKRLRDDLPYYCSKVIRIKDKQGQILPFKLNRAQQYLHARIEEQLRRTGKVRAVIVKGRQQGCCFAPEMRVLTSDYRWLEIDKVNVGERLIAADEYPPGGKGPRRLLREATVEAKREFYDEVLELTLDTGAVLRCTGRHRHLCQQRGGGGMQWRETSDIKSGDKIRYLTRPPQDKITFEDGWFSGLLDGEGSYASKKSGGVELKICQVDGPVLRRAKRYLEDRDIPYRVQVDRRPPGLTSKFGKQPVYALVINRIGVSTELMARTRPARFVDRKPWLGCAMPKDSLATVVSITATGRRRVVDLQTSEKTFICEGVVTHNSTYISARNFHAATFTPGTDVFILSHISDSTDHLFGMAKLFYEFAPPPIVPVIKTMNERRLEFEAIHSSYRIGTAGNAEIGRSLTVQRFHGSEVAKWENTDELVTGLLQAIPDMAGTEIVFESTANGVGNMFHKLAMKGIDPGSESEFMTIFIPWFWQDEYTKTPPEGFIPTPEEEEIMGLYALTAGQIYWRRRKVEDEFGGDVWKFRQEYPCTVQEAFVVSGVTLLDGKTIELARKSNATDPVAPLILGCDPARSKDRTVIVLRRGREVVKWMKYDTMDEMTLAGIIGNLIDRHNIVKAFIDTGYGWGTIDRLRESGYGQFVTGVHFGGKAIETDVYLNKRAEMYDAMRQWFSEGGVKIPDSDEFHMDLLAIPPLKETTSRGMLTLPPKEEIKKLFGRSPDIADSLALTFAFPVASTAVQNRVRRTEVDVRRTSSPLSTVRDFNRTKRGTTTHRDIEMFK